MVLVQGEVLKLPILLGVQSHPLEHNTGVYIGLLITAFCSGFTMSWGLRKATLAEKRLLLMEARTDL